MSDVGYVDSLDAQQVTGYEASLGQRLRRAVRDQIATPPVPVPDVENRRHG